MLGIKLSRIFCFLAFLFVTYNDTVCAYQLILPKEYIAFSGDLDVGYQIPSGVTLSNAYIRVALVTEGKEEEITNLGINSRYSNGTQTIACGILEVAGQYEFQMYMYSGGPLLKRERVIVRWPNMTISLPETHYAQSSSVHIKPYSSAKCNPKLNRYRFNLILEYAKDIKSISNERNIEVFDSLPFSSFSSNNTSIELKCILFNLSGVYRVSLTSSYSAISLIARSNRMLTSLNPAYKIILLSDTIFPCNIKHMIHYSLPQCPGDKDYNKIRIYMLQKKFAGSLAAPVVRTYVMEHPVDPDMTSFLTPCDLYKTQAIGYCFQMISSTRNGIIINQTEVCLSAHPDSVLPVDGGWGSWSSWSHCSTSCGPGEQSRYRMCDSPTPNYGGAFCEGQSIEWQHCERFCPDDIPITPLHSPKIDEFCACGCHLETDVGRIIASGRCTRTSTWLITVPKHHVIILKFNYLNLYENKQWVKVRNGGSPTSDLIAFSDGRSKLNHVTSSTNKMLVEFYSEPDSKEVTSNLIMFPLVPTKPIHVHGFIASFSSNMTTTTMPVSVLPVRSEDDPSIWESTVTIVGISLCGLVVITAIIFVIYHRTCHRRLHKYAMAAHDESPKRMCKSTSMPSSTSRESHHGIEIEHDMEIPLTGGINGTNDRKQRAKTPGSTRSKGSISSACSSGVKKLKTKADIEHGGSCRASPMTPGREYCQIPQVSSPKRKHKLRDRTSENEQNMSLFRTSPLTKTKVPRSPKIHPSPKVNKHRRTSDDLVEENESGKTKKDILSARFGSKEREARRVVMGSDHTPTNNVKSPPSDCQRIECETPTNVDNNAILRKHIKLKGDIDANEKKDITIKGDINLKDFGKSAEDIDRKPASGTSDDSTNSVDKGMPQQLTTSFIENGTKPRRPTSLTESYSKMSLASAISKGSTDGAKQNGDTPKDKLSINSSDDRQNALPKPDGQSPKSQRLETVKVDSKNSSPSKTSKTSTPRSVRSDISSKTKSPARSLNTPSDVIELEYDDFIDMDDTYSYFDPIETEKLTFHGVERVKVKTPKEEK